LFGHVSIHAGTIIREQSCAQLKLQNGFFVLVGIDAVNVMAEYQPVVQACGSQWRQELPDDGSCVKRNMSEQVL
jgi:hypothetical protein